MKTISNRVIRRTAHGASCLSVILVVSAAGAQEAGAQQATDQATTACVRAYQATQELRLDGQIRRARESAASCSQEGCPAAVRSGCTKWLRELIDNQPSLAVTAREGDKDLSDVAVYVDGERVADALTGRPIEVDAGKHVIKLVRRGSAPLEQTVIVIDGVKNRAVQFEFKSAQGAATPAPRRAAPRGAPVAGVILGGLGLGFLGTFSLLAFSGTRDLDRMRDTCGQTHTCLDTDIRAVKTKLIVGDAFLAAGVLSFGLGIALTIRHYAVGEPEANRTSAIRWSLTPHGGGGLASVSMTY